MAAVPMNPSWMINMKRHEPCAHLRPDYSRLELAHYIVLDPETREVSWEPHLMVDELVRLGLIKEKDNDT